MEFPVGLQAHPTRTRCPAHRADHVRHVEVAASAKVTLRDGETTRQDFRIGRL